MRRFQSAKRIVITFLLFLCCFNSVKAIKNNNVNYFSDEARIISDYIVDENNEKIETIKNKYNTELFILTVENLNGLNPTYYMDDFYNENSETKHCIIALIHNSDHFVYIKGYGNMKYYMTEDKADSLRPWAMYYSVKGEYNEFVEELISITRSYSMDAKKDILILIFNTYVKIILPLFLFGIISVIVIKRNKKFFFKLFKNIKSNVKSLIVDKERGYQN